MTTAHTVSTRTPALTALTSGAFLAEVALNSWLSRDYLHEHGWALQGGDNVPWPSMLALGPHGWVQVLAFALAGLGVLVMIPSLRTALPHRRGRRVTLTLMTLLGSAVLLSAARIDPSMIAQQEPTTWHGTVHGLMFIVLLPTTLLTPVALAVATRGLPAWRLLRRYSAVLPVLLLAVLVSNQGNLGFYLFLSLVFSWVSAVALTTGSRLRT